MKIKFYLVYTVWLAPYSKSHKLNECEQNRKGRFYGDTLNASAFWITRCGPVYLQLMLADNFSRLLNDTMFIGQHYIFFRNMNL